MGFLSMKSKVVTPRMVAQVLMDFCESVDYCMFHSNYKRDGQVGKGCLGVIVRGSVCNGVVFRAKSELYGYMRKRGISDVRGALGEVKFESYSSDSIIYFPDLTDIAW